jgi:hypothetical protein
MLSGPLDFFNNTLLPLGTPNSIPHRIYYQYLFKYLDSLPCEIDNRRLVIDEEKRNYVDKNLKTQQTEILMFMHQIYLKISEEGSTHAIPSSDLEYLLYAFGEWLKITKPAPEVTYSLHEHSLLKLALASLSNQILS